MEKNYKLALQYDGSRYDGWQRQGNTSRTIQGKLEAVLERMTGRRIEVHGSGRTDAGVHALGQTANFHMKTDLTDDEIREYLNQYLPEDIAVLSVSKAPERFHSRLSACAKTYLYRIETSDRKDVFERRYIYGLGRPLDVAAMKAAAAYLMGEHDFKSFCSNKNLKKSTVRNLYSAEVRQENTRLLLRYTADGFLYNMARIMTGTLVEVGMGERDPAEIGRIFAARDRQAAGFTAPPEGLFLECVNYRDFGQDK